MKYGVIEKILSQKHGCETKPCVDKDADAGEIQDPLLGYPFVSCLQIAR